MVRVPRIRTTGRPKMKNNKKSNIHGQGLETNNYQVLILNKIILMQ